MKTYIVTGAAGFIGSNLVDRLLLSGNKVLGIDNFSTGQIRFLENALKNPLFRLCRINLLDFNYLKKIIKNVDAVFHLAANADVRFGLNHPKKDIEQNIIVTSNVLEAMRYNDIKKIIFASTGSIYGRAKIIPTPEDAPLPIQTSLYATSKISCEGLISSYCEGFKFQSWIFRFVSILGERYTHGHVFDFYKQLLSNPKKLFVLGNGKQKKSYLYIQDCIDGIISAYTKANKKINIFNLGINDYINVNKSIKLITSKLNLNPKLYYSGGNSGWVGDNPFIYLNTSKIQKLNWKPKFSIEKSIIKTLQWLQDNKWLFKYL